MNMMETSTHDTALFAVSLYRGKRSVLPIRYYYATGGQAADAAERCRKANIADRVLVVRRKTPTDQLEAMPTQKGT